jgi:transaldolase
MRSPLHRLQELGQSVWLDSIRRPYLQRDGYLPRLITAGELNGLTSNPTIFEKALQDDSYDAQLNELRGAEPREAFWTLMKADVASACDLFLPQFRDSDRVHGWVSIECDPSKAFDTEATVDEAREVFADIDRPNLFVKVPGTQAGLPAITRLVAEGINVNVTLLFGVRRYEAVATAYVRGLERLAEAGVALSTVASVASFFVSRVDTEVDRRLEEIGTPEALELRGKAAVAQAQLAYATFLDQFQGPRWDALVARGARVQRPLWASTSTKNPAYPDTHYVDPLIGPDTVNTMPEVTLKAFADHGTLARTVDADPDAARATFDAIRTVGVDLDDVSRVLEDQGVASFAKSFDELITTLSSKAADLSGRSA